MIAPGAFVDGLLEMGFDYFACVPCSYFGPLLTELESRPDVVYQVASVEAEAIAMAAGATLSGRKALVMLQNSGLGNCVNPISSLLDPFAIPVVLLVSHRGLDAVDKKAPQHDMMGRITHELLDLLDMPAAVMPADHQSALAAFAAALEAAQQTCRPQAIILQGKPFAKGKAEPHAQLDRPTRLQAMKALDNGFSETTLVVASTGMVSRDLQTAGDRGGNFYMAGSMGLASSIALGLCSGAAGPVVIVDGDGSCLMRLGSLPTIGRYAPSNLLHVVLDNATHSSTGGQATASTNVNFPALALACGYASAAEVQSLEGLSAMVSEFRPDQGPRLLHFRIRSGNDPDPPRVERGLPQVKSDFMKAVQDGIRPL